MPAKWLPVIMQGTSDEIFVVDGASLRVLHASDAACSSTRRTVNELRTLTLYDLCDPAVASDAELKLRSLNRKNPAASLDTVLVRKDGSRCPISLRLSVSSARKNSAIIAIGKARAAPEDVEAPGQSQPHFDAIVANTPGLVFQFLLQADGAISFPYLSEGCQALLGISPESLRADPTRLSALVLPEDRDSYGSSMTTSASSLRSWNWEGRIWIDAWKDIKWINLRATPRATRDGVQWDGIMTNITQSKIEEMEIKRSRARLAELSAHVEQVKEQERTRIAREIHDDLGGNLTAIKMALTILARRLPSDNSDLAEKTAYVELLVDRTIEAAHRIASDLRPSILDCGIVAALEWQAGEFSTQLGIPCKFESNAVEIDLHPDQATAIFRISQEALTNIAKHANASWVGMQLTRTKNSLQLMISDDGKGMDAADRLKPQSFGIRGMIERANSLGGKLTIGPSPQGGNLVTVQLPLSLLADNANNINYRQLSSSSLDYHA